MEVRRKDLDAAVEAGAIGSEDAERLWGFLAARGEDTPRFSFTHVLYYLGGLIAIGAMSLFMTLGWNAFGGYGIAAIAVGYAILALALTRHFERRNLGIPAGIMATLAVVLVPLAIFGMQLGLGLWEGRDYRDYHVFIDWRWMMMELGTLAAGAILFYVYRRPFMLMPIAVTLWYMSMDLVPFLAGERGLYDWELRKFISLWFGIAMTLFAFWVDIRSRHGRDYAFWLYLFGTLTFWGGLSLLRSDSELGKFLYFLVNLAMILVGAVIGRRVFAVFGGLGVAGYLGHLSWRVFKDSIAFPFVLTLVGLGVIGLGILWQRNEAAISGRLRALLPRPLRELIEARAA